MLILSPFVVLLSLAPLHSVAAVINTTGAKDPEELSTRQFKTFQDNYQAYVQATVKARETGCTSENIVYRREWGSLSKKDRLNYIDAVYCLQKKAPWSSRADIPGSRSLYDDFVGTHIQQTPFVHLSGLFLTFHRYLVWLYEKALRDQCGYTGYQPYWDWSLSWEDPRNSTVFDGSPYSMGSNGQFIPHEATTISSLGLNLTVPPATGGGCVYSGPFTPDKYQLHLGPVTFEPRGADGGLAYNPRCLSRDLSPAWTNQTRPSKIMELLAPCGDVGCFDSTLESIPGVHAAGHFGMGGVGLDAFASAGDPAFWLHHAQVDRMWSIWQGQNPGDRTYQTSGTATALNIPPSENVTLDTVVDVGILAGNETVRRLSSGIDGPFCYMYV